MGKKARWMGDLISAPSSTLRLQIHFTILTNTSRKLEKYNYKLAQIHISVVEGEESKMGGRSDYCAQLYSSSTNTFHNFDKYI